MSKRTTVETNALNRPVRIDIGLVEKTDEELVAMRDVSTNSTWANLGERGTVSSVFQDKDREVKYIVELDAGRCIEVYATSVSFQGEAE